MDREITVSLLEDIVQLAERIAARRSKSVSQILTVAVTELAVREDKAYEAARQRHMAILEEGFDLGTDGKITWTRDELHDRRL